ncbi:uncharacterized protein LOC122241901 [Panthera tigris]|uniref:uncharacterized protein LOC122241901 n=1 Tax=Panthera tigris TaxID=9694 RepID=UPI001C6F9057|nr:uncharacterized protein LOC122241901 [Panthera tigris]
MKFFSKGNDDSQVPRIFIKKIAATYCTVVQCVVYERIRSNLEEKIYYYSVRNKKYFRKIHFTRGLGKLINLHLLLNTAEKSFSTRILRRQWRKGCSYICRSSSSNPRSCHIQGLNSNCFSDLHTFTHNVSSVMHRNLSALFSIVFLRTSLHTGVNDKQNGRLVKSTCESERTTREVWDRNYDLDFSDRANFSPPMAFFSSDLV